MILTTSLNRLGRTIATKELHAQERELDRHIDCGERLMGQIEELFTAVDEASTDSHRDHLVRSLTKMRADYNNHVQAAAHLIQSISKLRERAGKPPHILVDITATAMSR